MSHVKDKREITEISERGKGERKEIELKMTRDERSHTRLESDKNREEQERISDNRR